MSTLPGIPWKTRKAVLDVLASADVTIRQFQRAPEEGNALWAQIFGWTIAQIVDTHLDALQALEMSNPLLIFNHERMDEVPIE